MRDARSVEWSEFLSFLGVDAKRINLLSSAWDYNDVREEYAPNSRIEFITGWAAVDWDDLCAEVDVFQSREEAAMDLYGEEDPREVR